MNPFRTNDWVATNPMECLVSYDLEEFYQVESFSLSLSLIKFHVFSQSIGFKALGHSIPTIFIFCLSKIFELQKEALCV